MTSIGVRAVHAENGHPRNRCFIGFSQVIVLHLPSLLSQCFMSIVGFMTSGNEQSHESIARSIYSHLVSFLHSQIAPPVTLFSGEEIQEIVFLFVRRRNVFFSNAKTQADCATL